MLYPTASPFVTFTIISRSFSLTALNSGAFGFSPIEKEIHEPLFIDNHLGLIWIVAFEYEDNSLRGIHALGPAYSGRNSYHNIKKELDKHDLSVSNRIKVFKLFDHIPIIPTNQLFQYAVMLHYCVTGRRITTNDLRFTEKASGKPSSRLNTSN